MIKRGKPRAVALAMVGSLLGSIAVADDTCVNDRAIFSDDAHRFPRLTTADKAKQNDVFCSAARIGKNLFVSSAHCFVPDLQEPVIQFDVPVSGITSKATDFPVDKLVKGPWKEEDENLADDWAVFSVGPNTNGDQVYDLFGYDYLRPTALQSEHIGFFSSRYLLSGIVGYAENNEDTSQGFKAKVRSATTVEDEDWAFYAPARPGDSGGAVTFSRDQSDASLSGPLLLRGIVKGAFIPYDCANPGGKITGFTGWPRDFWNTIKNWDTVKRIGTWTNFAVNDPNFANKFGFTDESMYGTIQTVYVEDTLEMYMIARSQFALHTYRARVPAIMTSAPTVWEELKALPLFSNDNGWDSDEYWPSIKLSVGKHRLVLIANGEEGLITHILDLNSRDSAKWERQDQILTEFATYRDDGHGPNFNVEVAVVGEKIPSVDEDTPGEDTRQEYIVARNSVNGLDVRKLDDEGNWGDKILPLSGSAFDAFKNDFNTQRTRVSFRAFGVGDKLYIAGRTPNGVVAYKNNAIEPNDPWNALPYSPASGWTDVSGWHSDAYANNVKFLNVGGQMVIVGRLGDGVYAYRLEDDDTWTTLLARNPDWSKAEKYNQPKYYDTFQAVSDGTNLILATNAHKGMLVTRVTGVQDIRGQADDTPDWSNRYPYWSEASSYETIQVLGYNIPGDKRLFLAGRLPEGMNTMHMRILE